MYGHVRSPPRCFQAHAKLNDHVSDVQPGPDQQRPVNGGDERRVAVCVSMAVRMTVRVVMHLRIFSLQNNG